MKELEKIISELNKAINHNERHGDFNIGTETVRVYLGQLSQAIQALQQNESKIDKAIKKFEEAKSKSESLRDVVYLDGVLAVLDTIKNKPTPPNE